MLRDSEKQLLQLELRPQGVGRDNTQQAQPLPSPPDQRLLHKKRNFSQRPVRFSLTAEIEWPVLPQVCREFGSTAFQD